MFVQLKKGYTLLSKIFLPYLTDQESPESIMTDKKNVKFFFIPNQNRGKKWSFSW